MILAFLEFLARLAPLGTLIVALTAIIVAMRQWKTVRQNEAMKQYLSYLDESMKYPKYAVGEIEKNDLIVYNQFLNKAFLAHESILREYPKDKEWKISITQHLRLHLKNVDKYADEFKHLNLESYSKEFQDLSASLLEELREANSKENEYEK